MTEMKQDMIPKNKRYDFRMAEVLCACFVLSHKRPAAKQIRCRSSFPSVRHVPGFSDIRADKISASPGF